MAKVRTYKNTVTTTGSAGVATGATITEALHGRLIDIYFDFAAAPATTDTTVAFTDYGGNVIVLSNTSTDVLKAPRMPCVDSANAAITNSFAEFPLNQTLTVSLAQCDALAPALTFYIRYWADN